MSVKGKDGPFVREIQQLTRSLFLAMSGRVIESGLVSLA